jgi:hypothetical protein
MKAFMVVHKAPKLSWKVVEKNWRRLADVESATWICTYFNVGKGMRYCVWQAPDAATLEKVFRDLEISFESLTEVEETTPDMWGVKWEEHLEAEATADTLGI